MIRDSYKVNESGSEKADQILEEEVRGKVDHG
jgi:hypothetical protein